MRGWQRRPGCAAAARRIPSDRAPHRSLDRGVGRSELCVLTARPGARRPGERRVSRRVCVRQTDKQFRSRPDPRTPPRHTDTSESRTRPQTATHPIDATQHCALTSDLSRVIHETRFSSARLFHTPHTTHAAAAAKIETGSYQSAIDLLLEVLEQLRDSHAALLGRVALAQRHGVVVERLKVDSDAIRRAIRVESCQPYSLRRNAIAQLPDLEPRCSGRGGFPCCHWQ